MKGHYNYQKRSKKIQTTTKLYGTCVGESGEGGGGNSIDIKAKVNNGLRNLQKPIFLKLKHRLPDICYWWEVIRIV